MENTSTETATAPARNSWAFRIGKLAQWLVLLAVAAALIALTLARYDVIEKLQGFSMLAYGVMGTLAGAVIGLIALIIGLIGKSGPKRPALIALGVALLALGTLFLIVRPGLGAPMLHDITTNVDAPPQFATLTLREDNLVPFKSAAEWQAAHRAAHPDLGPITLPGTPAEVLTKARDLAEARGWEVAAFDPATGHMEATAFAGYIKFRDDVIVDVTAQEGGGSLVNMRSVSRVGVGDLGYNAARVKEFLGALAAE